MKQNEDDIEAALSGLLSDDLISKIKKFKKDYVGDFTPEAINEFISILVKAVEENYESRDKVTNILGIDVFGIMSEMLRNPSVFETNEEFKRVINSKKLRSLFKSSLPKESAEKILDSQSFLDFFINFTEAGRLVFKGVTEEYYEYTSSCRKAIDQLLNEMFGDISKIKTRVNYVKGIENARDIVSLVNSYHSILSEVEELRHWKKNINLQYIREKVLPIYRDFANKYEMVSKFVLIDILICEGRFNPNVKYMELSLGDIVNLISRSPKFSILGEVDTIIRNSLDHGEKYRISVGKNTIRFFDRNRHEDLTYMEIIDKTCRLASLFLVNFSYLAEGHKKEFEI